LAVRITLGFDQVSQIVERWIDHVDQIITFQHDEANRIHCHLLLLNCRVTTQRLKQLSLRTERGQGFWSFKACDNDLQRYITYMGKGSPDNLCGSRVGRYEHYLYREVIEFISRWVAPKGPPLRPALQKYQEFEAIVRAMPEEERRLIEQIRGYATSHVFNRWGMFTQQANNEISNYWRTYCFKYHLRV